MNKDDFFEEMKNAETQEALKIFLKTRDAEKYIQPFADSRVSQALATFKKNLSVDDFLPRIEAVEKSLELKESELQKTKLDNYLFKQCNKKGVPYELINDYPFINEHEIDEKIESYKRETDALRANALNDSIAKNRFIPSGSATIKSRTNLAGMSQKEIDSFEAAGILDAMIEHY